MSAIAQDSWKVCLDKKVLLNTSTENEEKNVIKISSSDLKNAKTFVVNYTKASLQKGWERTILLFDEKDNKLRTQRGKKFTLKASGLKALLDKYKTIKVYTINAPTDPKLKAQVRLRRVHLCTLVLQ
jgi:hypothetical protein